MANPSFVQGNKTIAAATTVSVAYPSNNTLGNLLIAVVACGNTGLANIAVTDTAGNVWTKLDTETLNTQSTSQFWYVQQCKAGANTVTGHDTTGNSTVTNLLIGEYQSGTTGFHLALDAHAVASNFTSTPASPNCTTTVNNDLLIGWTGNVSGTAITAGLIGGSTALVQESQSNTLAFEDGNGQANTAGSNSATFGGSQTVWSCGIAAFKVVANGGGGSIVNWMNTPRDFVNKRGLRG